MAKARVCKTLIRGFDSHPGLKKILFHAAVVELADTGGLKLPVERRVGSTPTRGTTEEKFLII